MIEQCCPYATDACCGRNMPVCPYDGPVYGCRREELMLPMQDGVRLYTEIFKPEGLAQFPVLIQRSCYPHQQPLYEINGAELTRRGYGYVVQTCRGGLTEKQRL